MAGYILEAAPYEPTVEAIGQALGALPGPGAPITLTLYTLIHVMCQLSCSSSSTNSVAAFQTETPLPAVESSEHDVRVWLPCVATVRGPRTFPSCERFESITLPEGAISEYQASAGGSYGPWRMWARYKSIQEHGIRSENRSVNIDAYGNGQSVIVAVVHSVVVSRLLRLAPNQRVAELLHSLGDVSRLGRRAQWTDKLRDPTDRDGDENLSELAGQLTDATEKCSAL